MQIKEYLGRNNNDVVMLVGDSAYIENVPREIAPVLAVAQDLLEGCKAMMGYMESGFLVRDTKDDDKSDWALKSLSFVRDVQKMHAAIKAAEVSHV